MSFLSDIHTLENQFQRQDDLRVVCEGGCYARHGRLADAVGKRRCVDVVRSTIYVEICMIEQIVKFSAALERHPFLGQWDVLANGGILEVQTGLAEGVARETSIKWSIYRDFASERNSVGDASTGRVVDLVQRKIEKVIGRCGIRN
jgi:hypothetical protein